MTVEPRGFKVLAAELGNDPQKWHRLDKILDRAGRARHAVKCSRWDYVDMHEDFHHQQLLEALSDLVENGLEVNW